ncbi:neutral protease 2-like protein [Pleomassaria siparia CBS 279.74]|uniref:Neutral protease 2 n=1 Tax=Pleomassaria siparia CBS 279.74 TaxID=1314801 RepID=A0A6G1KC32_9PLEO|nr:neutral protease 2-like protein [Pleomassaria siparia CBS 279.74]
MKGFTQISLVALASYVSATAINVNKRASPLSVELTASGNSEVTATFTNNGATALNLLNKGTVLDEVNPVEKVKMFTGDAKVTFEGIKLRIMTSGLSTDDFTAIGAGETKTITVETAALHAVNEGGHFDVFAEGQIPFAAVNTTKLAGSIPYESNKLSMSINGTVASTVAKALKRSTVGSSCTGTKLTAVNTALSNCAKLATSAASAATAGTKITTYFKTASSATVSARLKAVASDCSGATSKTSTNCNDAYSGCSSNVLAYTVPSASYITYCPIFFSALPALTTSCHAQDQATTVLHEETHASSVYSPGTEDNGYGYAAATALSANAALNNADSYALYANAIYANC